MPLYLHNERNVRKVGERAVEVGQLALVEERGVRVGAEGEQHGTARTRLDRTQQGLEGSAERVDSDQLSGKVR